MTGDRQPAPKSFSIGSGTAQTEALATRHADRTPDPHHWGARWRWTPDTGARFGSVRSKTLQHLFTTPEAAQTAAENDLRETFAEETG